jgi:hypothetical protein
MEAKNIDDVLVGAMTAHMTGEKVPQPVEHVVEHIETPDIKNDEVQESQDIQAETPTNSVESSNKPVTEEKAATDSPIDEYGNPVEKARLYTEEELNQRIRDRLSRGKYAEEQYQPPQQPIQQPQQQVDDDVEEDWRTQLRREIRTEMTQAQQEANENAWRQQESAKQADFESKFTSGMGKYQDFQQVVANKPITDHMLLATRNLDNPAAFIYGAAKLHPQELSRIASIQDPYAQASEVGRLHERMIKERKVASDAHKPLQAPKGDLPQKNAPSKISLEDRIQQYAKQKRK